MHHRLLNLCLTLVVLLAAERVRAHALHVYERPVQETPVYVVTPAPTVHQVQVIEPPRVLRVNAAPAAESSSVLRYSVQGFFAGALAGLSVGYLATDRGHAGSWRSLVLATGIGALSGAGLGLGLGFLDVAADRHPASARFVMRDAAYGTLLGAALGASVGGLVALESRAGSDALFGAAIGSISGFVVGGLAGLLEGRWRERRVTGGVTLSQDVSGRRLLGPSVQGRF